MTARDESEEGKTLPETWVERGSRILCEAVLLGMVVMISAEVVARLFHFSFEFVDELGGYLLSALTFLSLSVALIGGAYHQVDYLQDRLGRRGRAVSGVVFLSLSLIFALVLAWQLWRLVTRSFASNVVAPSILGTPLWIPQAVMLLGVAALIYSLVRMLHARIRTLRESNHA
jgi:TRAP-type C4-dicarboxylate transport system permease small subunit